MANRKVRVNSNYVFHPVLFDVLNPPANQKLVDGDVVKVVNIKGCPPANTMGMCYVNREGVFAGMVCTNSLIPVAAYKRMFGKK